MVDPKPEPANNPLMYGGLLPQEEMVAMGKKFKKLTIGIPREKHQVEQRVSLAPEAVEVLVNNGHDVLLESKAGEGAKYTDNDYSECGAFIIDSRKQVLNADIILKATMVDGVYDSDPKKNPNAIKFDTISFAEALTRRLGSIMDSTALSLCMDNKIPLIVFDLSDPNNILRVISGEKIGTIVE